MEALLEFSFEQTFRCEVTRQSGNIKNQTTVISTIAHELHESYLKNINIA